MSHRAAFLIVFFVAFTGPSPSQEGTPTIESLAWLAGCWENASDNMKTEEQWMKPSGGSMLGVSRTVKGGKTMWYEFLQIRQYGDSVVYIANPSGQKEAAFKLVRWNDKEAVFENPAHDFPQRIIYELQTDGSLHARIEGKQKGKDRVEHFPMKRAKCG